MSTEQKKQQLPEVLTFTLSSEEYGVDLPGVGENRGYDSVIRIANAPDHLNGDRVIRMAADSVSDVIILSPEQIKLAPEIGTAFNTGHLISPGTVGERMIILPSIELLMHSPEMAMIEAPAA